MVKRFFYRVFCGFFLGLSVFAPGFSGSVIAIIMGIYRDIVRIASNPFKNFKRNVIFCIPLGIGAALSAVLLTQGLSYLFENYAQATYFLFVGLIFGNLPVIMREVKKCGLQKRYLIGGAAAFGLALVLALLSAGVDESPEAASALTTSLPMLALGGVAAGASVLVPGMSVSMILILIGVYDDLMFMANALLHLEFKYLLPFGLAGGCAVIALVLSSRLIKLVFDRFPGFANSMVLGFMGGSLVGILIDSIQMRQAGFRWWHGALALAAGLGISLLFVVLGKKVDVSSEEEQVNVALA